MMNLGCQWNSPYPVFFPTCLKHNRVLLVICPRRRDWILSVEIEINGIGMTSLQIENFANRETREAPVVRTRATIDFLQAGIVVAVRSVENLLPWDYTPRRIAVIALDGEHWCFGWVDNSRARTGQHVRFLKHDADHVYPTFAPDLGK